MSKNSAAVVLTVAEKLRWIVRTNNVGAMEFVVVEAGDCRGSGGA